MHFAYQARDSGGRIRDGEIAAADTDEAARLLRRDGLYLLSLKEKAADAAAGIELALFGRRVSRSDVIYFTNQLAIMVDAGVPLAEGLEGLARQTENPRFKRILSEVRTAVESGDDLSTALARFPGQFDSTYVNLVKASEVSGTLAPMLDRISTQARADLETRSKVKGALMYPGVMLLMCVSVSVFLLAYVFPKLTPMFESRSLELPGPTAFMMALSNGMIHGWYWFILGAVAVVGGFLWARKQRWGRIALDWFWIHVPIIGPLLRKVAISRSIRTLATTINAGVPVLEAMRLGSAVSGNVFYERVWEQAAERVTAGKQIHEALEGCELFPATLLQMIASGETTGKLGAVLDKVSDYFDSEVSNTVKTTTSLLEPIMVFAMGGIIGTIALAMLLPIFKLSTGH
ncbi:MAG: type II secretion system F family protein [Planctomycetaceae bacterium]